MTNSIKRRRILSAFLGAVEMSAILIIIFSFVTMDSGGLFDMLFYFIFMVLLPVAVGIGIFLGIRSAGAVSPWAFAKPCQVIISISLAFVLIGYNGLFQEMGFIKRPEPLKDPFTTASVDYLIKSLDDPLPENKVRAAEELIQRQYLSAGDLMIPLLQDKSGLVRGRVTRLLGQLHDKRAAERIITLLDDPDYETQLEAVRALGEIRDNRAVTPLLTMLNKPNFSGVVAEALAKIGNRQAVGPLIEFLENANREDQIQFRNWAIHSLEKLSGQKYGDDIVRWQQWYETENKK